MVPLAPGLESRRACTGRPPKDRAALATAFLAKSHFSQPHHHHQLIDRLRCDRAIHSRLCGWNGLDSIPHESKFSRAFEEFAQSQRLIGHIARDSSAIPVREHFPDPRPLKPPSRPPSKHVSQAGTKAASKSRTTKKSRHTFLRAKASQRGTRMERQRHMELPPCSANSLASAALGSKPAARAISNTGAATNSTSTLLTGRSPSALCSLEPTCMIPGPGHPADDHHWRASPISIRTHGLSL